MDELPLEIIKSVDYSPFEVQLCNLGGETGVLFRLEDLDSALALPPTETFTEYHNNGEGYSGSTARDCAVCDSNVETIYHMRSFDITCKNDSKYGEVSNLKTLCEDCILNIFEIRNSVVEDEFQSILLAELV